MEKLEELGKKVRARRKALKLTQAQLAHKIDKDRESISRLERGGVNPSYLYLLELCSGLETTLADLVSNS